MSGEQDLINLYSGRILALAASIPHTERLPNPDASARKRSPLCGSTVAVDLNILNGRISDFGQDVKACALGQAAASVVGEHVIGCDLTQVKTARSQLYAMLKEGGPPPLTPFDTLGVLLPARDYKNRHASIMLALDAVCEAFETVQNADCA